MQSGLLRVKKKLQGRKSEKQGGQLESWGNSLVRGEATWNGWSLKGEGMAIIMGEGWRKRALATWMCGFDGIVQKGLTKTFQLLRAPALRPQHAEGLGWPLPFHGGGALRRAPCRLQFSMLLICVCRRLHLGPIQALGRPWRVQEPQIAQSVFLGKVESSSLITFLTALLLSGVSQCNLNCCNRIHLRLRQTHGLFTFKMFITP